MSSGMNPDEIARKLSGNGPTGWPPSMNRVAPRNSSMPARVTMNDGTRR